MVGPHGAIGRSGVRTVAVPVGGWGDLKPREVALDGGFPPEASNAVLGKASVFIAGRQQPAARRSRKRLASYRVGCEGRISQLKRSYGLRRSRLRRHEGARTWVGWAIMAYNLDTLAVQTT